MAYPPMIWRVNRQPRFTALQMGDYMAADDGPRETILRGMKYERGAPTLLYHAVTRAVARYLTSPTRDRRHLAGCREALEDQLAEADNPQKRENLSRALRSLDAFEASLNALPVAGLQITPAPMARRRVRIEGVDINVQPLANIRAVRPRGADLVGALILDPARGYASKTPEGQAKATLAMEYAAALIHQHVAATMCGDGAKASPEHCIVFHAHRGERVCAPASYKKKLRGMEAACRVIARAWEHVTPPPSFDETLAMYRG